MKSVKAIFLTLLFFISYPVNGTGLQTLLRRAVRQIEKSQMTISSTMGNKFSIGIDSGHVGSWYATEDLGNIYCMVYKREGHFKNTSVFEYFIKYYLHKKIVFRVEIILPFDESERAQNQLNKIYFKVADMYWVDTKKKFYRKKHAIYIDKAQEKCMIEYKNNLEIE